ncbi:MAG: hypothetical protein U5L75_03195 [Candidatus Campbellbacteria bacterium]|nr:hypothetical protein [Candidatus Campbellbacteria bacterium]
MKTKSEEEPVAVTDGGVSVSTTAEQFETDRDSDGLRDWEEVMWRTDPENPDTDGDGTPDGEEVETGRDPRVPGPNDELSTNDTPTFFRESNEGLTTTEAFYRDYFQGLNELSASGNFNDSSIDALLSELTQKYVQNSIGDIESIPERYDASDISTMKTSSKADIRTYGNVLGVIAGSYTNISIEEEHSSVQEAVENENTSALNEIISTYETATAELLSIENVPQGAAEYHLQIINGTHHLATTLKSIRDDFDADPLKSLIGLVRYQKGYVSIAEGNSGLVSYFNNNNVTFSANEPGYVITNTDSR